MKKLILIAIIIPVIAGFAFSQAMPGGVTSPQSTATQGRFRSAADNFIRPDSFSGVSFNSFFAVTSFASNNLYLGAATKFNDLYFATAYAGTLWGNYKDFPYSEYKDLWRDGDKTVPHYNTIPTFTTSPTPNNNIALLFGLADMGFRFTYSTTHQGFSEKDFIGDSTEFKSYKTAYGRISPQLAWSMTKNLMPAGVKPWATIDLSFLRDYARGEAYVGTETTGEIITHSNNSFTPKLTIGLGGFTFYENQSNFRASADLEYSISFTRYSNDYSYQGGDGKYKIKSISGLNDSGDLYEFSNILNSLTPSASAQWSGGPIALRLRLALPLNLSNTGTTEMELNTDDPTNGNLKKDGEDSSSTFINFGINLQLAAQWKILSNLSLNAGGLIQASPIGRTTTKGEIYNQGVKVDNSSFKSVRKVFNPTSTSLTAGVTYNVTNNMTFEASMGTSNRVISVFDGFFDFVSLLVSLKF